MGFTAHNLLSKVMESHLTLAVDLLGMVKKTSTDDPTHRYQIAAVVVFLAGVDKTLGLALLILYLGGHVSWESIGPRGKKVELDPGRLVCWPGLTGKLTRLKALGLDLEENLQWLVEIWA